MSTNRTGARVAYSAGDYLHDAEVHYHAAVAGGIGSPEGRELTALSQAASLLVIAQLKHRHVVAIEGMRGVADRQHQEIMDTWCRQIQARHPSVSAPTAASVDDASDLLACATIARTLYGKAMSAGSPSKLDGELARKFLADFVEAMQHVADESCA